MASAFSQAAELGGQGSSDSEGEDHVDHGEERDDELGGDDDGRGFLIAGLFPPYEAHWFRKATAELCYCQHGGSGFSFNRGDLLEMDLDEIEFFLEWLDERREKEAEAIRKASKPKGRR